MSLPFRNGWLQKEGQSRDYHVAAPLVWQANPPHPYIADGYNGQRTKRTKRAKRAKRAKRLRI